MDEEAPPVHPSASHIRVADLWHVAVVGGDIVHHKAVCLVRDFAFGLGTGGTAINECHRFPAVRDAPVQSGPRYARRQRLDLPKSVVPSGLSRLLLQQEFTTAYTPEQSEMIERYTRRFQASVPGHTSACHLNV